MLIRPLIASDADAFWQLRLRGFVESPESFNTDPDEWHAHPISEIETMLRGETGTPDDIVLGAFDPALSAHVGLRREARRKRAHRATLWGLYVAPEARGQRIGTRLVEALIERARAMPSLTVLQLTVMAHNVHAIGIYRQLGFRRFGYQSRAAKDGDRYFDEEHHMLELDLPASPRRVSR